MTDADDRPDWLPAPLEDASSTKGSSWQRAASFLAKLPSLFLIALGIGLIMMAGASLASDRKRDFGSAIALVCIAILAFGLAAILRSLRWTWHINQPRSTGLPKAGSPMTAQQFFSALLRALAIWQFVNVIAEAPQLIVLVTQISNAARDRAALVYLLGPVLRAVLGGVIFVLADSLARRIYPDP